MQKGLARLKEYKLEELDFIKKLEPEGITTIDSYKIVVTNRLLTLLNSQTCTGCGLVANKIYMETFPDSTGRSKAAHFNFYYVKGREERLFTRDHIIPKSKSNLLPKGINVDSIQNSQTMCNTCNQSKSNNIEFPPKLPNKTFMKPNIESKYMFNKFLENGYGFLLIIGLIFGLSIFLSNSDKYSLSSLNYTVYKPKIQGMFNPTEPQCVAILAEELTEKYCFPVQFDLPELVKRAFILNVSFENKTLYKKLIILEM